MKVTLLPRAAVRGALDAPGDKSLSHRALLFAALADGPSTLTHLGPGADVASTAGALRSMGVEVDWQQTPGGPTAHVVGRGPSSFTSPTSPIDCGNSGTSMRLLAGLVAGLGLDATLIGDEALSRRPMRRVLAPLREMGARAEGEPRADNEVAPLVFRSGSPLTGRSHDLAIASAQVKSCLALAGLFAAGETRVREPARSRDHTERMLQALGAPLRVVDDEVVVERLQGALAPLGEARIPGDPSSAAFFVVAALLAKEGALTLRGVNLNPTRIGFLHVVERMGATVERLQPSSWLGEPQADLHVKAGQPLRAITIGATEVPSLVDEVPILATLATQAEGRTEIRDAGELRVKESDRLATTAAGLNALGARVTELEDGLIIEGPTPLHGATVESHQDHRIAMSLAVAALAVDGPISVNGAEWVDTSFPGFFALLDEVAPPQGAS